MSVDSHIQIPNGVLKHFRDSSGRVHYLDVTTGKMGLTSSKNLGTEYGYYSDTQELFLNKEIENPLTSLASKVRLFQQNGCGTLTLPQTEEVVLKKYITSAMARSRLSLDAFLAVSETAFLCSDQQNHDDLVYFSICRNNGIAEILEDHFLVILINKTEKNLVVPRNCFYALSSQGMECIVAPISPQCALCLFPPEYAEQSHISKEYRLCVVENVEDVARMNQRALMYEYMYNKTFLASASQEELKELLAFRDEHEEELEALWTKAHDAENMKKKVRQSE